MIGRTTRKKIPHKNKTGGCSFSGAENPQLLLLLIGGAICGIDHRGIGGGAFDKLIALLF